MFQKFSETYFEKFSNTFLKTLPKQFSEILFYIFVCFSEPVSEIFNIIYREFPEICFGNSSRHILNFPCPSFGTFQRYFFKFFESCVENFQRTIFEISETPRECKLNYCFDVKIYCSYQKFTAGRLPGSHVFGIGPTTPQPMFRPFYLMW